MKFLNLTEVLNLNADMVAPGFLNAPFVFKGKDSFKKVVQEHLSKHAKWFQRCDHVVLPDDPASAISLMSAFSGLGKFPKVALIEAGEIKSWVDVPAFYQQVRNDRLNIFPRGGCGSGRTVIDASDGIYSHQVNKLAEILGTNDMRILRIKAASAELDSPVDRLSGCGLTWEDLKWSDRLVYKPKCAMISDLLLALTLYAVGEKWPQVIRSNGGGVILEVIQPEKMRNLVAESLTGIGKAEISVH